jgi:hypothetical protein
MYPISARCEQKPRISVFIREGGNMRQIKPVVWACCLVVLLGSPTVLLAVTESSHFAESIPIESGQRVVVDASFHRVEVTASSGSSVNVVVDLEVSASASKAQQWLADYQPEVTVKGDTIRIRSTREKKGWSWGSTSGKGLITVEMPTGHDLVVDNSSGSVVLSGDFGDAVVRVDNSSGSVRGEAAMTSLAVDNSSGGTRFTALRPLERFNVDCSSGSVRLEGGAHDVNVDASSGSVRLRGLLGDAHVDTSSGSVELSWSSIAPAARVHVDNSSGGARLEFPLGTDLKGTISTSSGGIRSDFPGESNRKGNSLRLTGGTNAVSVRVSTSSGGVKLVQSR